MSGIVRAELVKVLRRPMTWIALAVVLAILATVQTLLTVLAFLPQVSPNQGEQPVDPGQLFVDLTVLPGGLVNGLNFVPGLGVFALVVVAASTTGNEFTWGTVVPLLSRGANRAAVVLAKLAALTVAAVAWLVATLAVAFALSAVASLVHLGHVPLGWLDGAMALELLLGLGRSLLALAPYVAAAIAMALLFRSPAIAMAVVLGYVIVEQVGLTTLMALRPMMGGTLGRVIGLVDTASIGSNADRLTSLNTLALSPLTEGIQVEHPYRAAVILVAYTALFAVVGILALRRRDIALRPS